MPSKQFVCDHFERLGKGDNASFYRQLADDVIIKVKGPGNPLHGTYSSKSEYHAKYLTPLGQRMSTKITRTITNVIAMGDHAVVEFTSTGTGKNGTLYEVDVMWLVKYSGEEIVEITMYMDSAIMKKGFDEND